VDRRANDSLQYFHGREFVNWVVGKSVIGGPVCCSAAILNHAKTVSVDVFVLKQLRKRARETRCKLKTLRG
jgi:hypothetical protein